MSTLVAAKPAFSALQTLPRPTLARTVRATSRRHGPSRGGARATKAPVRIPFPEAVTAAHGTVTLKRGCVFDCETGRVGGPMDGTGDIRWEFASSRARSMTPIPGARIAHIGGVEFDAVSPGALQALRYGTEAICGDDDASNRLTPGDVFAVETSGRKFCKLRVLSYGETLQIRYETYSVGPRVPFVATVHNIREDIMLAAVPAVASRLSSRIVAGETIVPWQMEFDADRAQLFVIERGGGTLLKIDAATGAKTTITAELDHPAGIAISADQRAAYVAEHSTAGGRIRAIDLSTGAASELVGGLSTPFTMHWESASKERLTVTERDPSQRVTLLDVGRGLVCL